MVTSKRRVDDLEGANNNHKHDTGNDNGGISFKTNNCMKQFPSNRSNS